MKKRFSEEQIVGFQRGANAGMAVKKLCRKQQVRRDERAGCLTLA